VRTAGGDRIRDSVRAGGGDRLDVPLTIDTDVGAHVYAQYLGVIEYPPGRVRRQRR
jgi:hypothetical protein